MIAARPLLASFALAAACATTAPAPQTGAAMSTSAATSTPTSAPASHVGRVRHVVLFKFKDSTPPEELRKVEAAFAALPGKIPQIRDFEWGTDMSPEGLQAGHTHAFLVTFDTAADRDAYLPHPAHKEFVEILKPLLEKATVVDFVAKTGP
jgi:hypothetical protein